MAEKRVNAGSIALCRAAESSYGTAATPTHLLYARDMAGATTMQDTYDNVGEANGNEESTLLLPTQTNTVLEFSNVPAYDLSLIYLLSHTLGSTGSGAAPSGATATKKFQWYPNVIGTSLKSQSVQVNHSDLSTGSAIYENTLYKGCVVDSYTLSGSVGSKTWTQSVKYVCSGDTSAGSSISSLIPPSYGPFLFNNTYCYFGSDYTPGSLVLPTSGQAPTGAEMTNALNLTPYLLGVTYSVQNNIDIEGSHQGSLGTLATTLPERAGRKQTLSLEFKWDPADSGSFLKTLRSNTIPSTYQSYSAANSTACVIQCFSNVPIDASGTIYCYSFALGFELLWLESVKMGVRNGKRTITANFNIGKASNGSTNAAIFLPGTTGSYGN